jgi:hypothetical protein
VPDAELAWFAAVDCDDPDFPRACSRRRAVDIGRQFIFERTAARESNRAGVWRPCELTDVEAVVIGIGSDRLRFDAATRIGDPDIPHTLLDEHPRDCRPSRRSREMSRKRRLQYLFYRERSGKCRGDWSLRQQGQRHRCME